LSRERLLPGVDDDQPAIGAIFDSSGDDEIGVVPQFPGLEVDDCQHPARGAATPFHQQEVAGEIGWVGANCAPKNRTKPSPYDMAIQVELGVRYDLEINRIVRESW